MTKDHIEEAISTERALDLALEALEYIENNYMSLPKSGTKAITAIKQARSAPYVASPRVQEPVAFNAGVPPLYPEMKDGETISVEYTTPPGGRQSEDCLTAAQEDIQRLSALVRAQQITIDKLEAQRKWVGLTQQDIDIAFDDTQEGGSFNEFARAIEAKLKEKNGLHRQHVIDGSPCWCEPVTSYTDPETGASVVVHKEPQ